jgi:hypothetical protein
MKHFNDLLTNRRCRRDTSENLNKIEDIIKCSSSSSS